MCLFLNLTSYLEWMKTNSLRFHKADVTCRYHLQAQAVHVVNYCRTKPVEQGGGCLKRKPTAFSSTQAIYLHTAVVVVVSFANFQQFSQLDLYKMIQRLRLREDTAPPLSLNFILNVILVCWNFSRRQWRILEEKERKKEFTSCSAFQI